MPSASPSHQQLTVDITSHQVSFICFADVNVPLVDIHAAGVKVEQGTAAVTVDGTCSPLTLSTFAPPHAHASLDMHCASNSRLRNYSTIEATPAEFASVEAQLVESMQGVMVVEVLRVQHRLFWRRYAERRRELRKKYPEGPVELRLWHGTSHTNPRDILNSESGLDASRGVGGFYGEGRVC